MYQSIIFGIALLLSLYLLVHLIIKSGVEDSKEDNLAGFRLTIILLTAFLWTWLYYLTH